MENIYEFTLNKKVKKQVEKKRKNKQGEEETILSTQTVNCPVKFIIKKPTRRLADDAELFYSIQLSKAIKMGIVTKAMLIKKYADNGGALSEEESRELLKSMKKLNDLENEYKLLEVTKNKAEKEKSEKILTEIITLRRELQDLESSLQSVYQHTADAKAEKDTLLWYVIKLSRMIEEDQEKEIFEGLDFEEKLEDLYNKYESEEAFEAKAISTICKVIGYWFYNHEVNPEKIKKFIEDSEQ